MTSDSNILTQWHIKLMIATLKNYRELRVKFNKQIKPHSLFTVLAIFVTIGPFNLIQSIRFVTSDSQFFILLLKIVTVLTCIGFYIVAFYNWRVFLSMRTDGTNKDANLFFAESAGLYRKLIFYIALAIDIIRSFQSYFNHENVAQQMKRLKYQTQSGYYHDAGLAILDSIVLSILFVECLRILSPKTSSWNDKKHSVIVASISLSISAFRVLILYRCSAPGTLDTR